MTTDNINIKPSIKLKPTLRIVLSLLIALHLIAVFLGPFAVPPSSSMANRMRSYFQPYIQLVDLDHGYKFFAPSPGPSHLIRYEVTSKDGKTIAEGTFPDLEDQWPRLLYHRYFMMSEWLYSQGSMFMKPVKPKEVAQDSPQMQRWVAEVDDWAMRVSGPQKPNNVTENSSEMKDWQEQYQDWQRTKNLYDLYLHSYVKQLTKRYGPDCKVKFFLVTHLLPSQQEVINGMKLDNKNLFQETQIYPAPQANPSNAKQIPPGIEEI